MKHALVVVVLASTFTFFTKPGEEQKLPSASGALGVEVECEPSARSEIHLLRRPTPNSYNCSAYVFDVNDMSRGIAGTNVVVEAGERQSKTSSNEDTEVKFTVAISKGHDRAATDVVVTKAGKTVLWQKSNVVLMTHARD